MNKIEGGGMIFLAIAMVITGLILQLQIIDWIGWLIFGAGGIIVIAGVVRMITGRSRA
ncbi:MAG: hypothetical protein QGF12_05050 [SAR202 cluster bacterium]|nr:hypothetical protein [SAR202 cluster bacterium]